MRLLILSVCVIFLAGLSYSQNTENWRPVVLWHGMGDSCCDPLSMGRIKRMIEKAFPGIYVYSVEIGNNTIEDEFNSFFKNVNDQLVQMHEKVNSHPELAQGFNAIGFSQGGQFLRGYTERFNTPPVYNLITLGGQHQGVFGFPNCPAPNVTLCQDLADLLTIGAYDPFVQSFVVQAEYWQDTMIYDIYLASSVFLADINNAKPKKNETYKENLITINNFVMVKFENDTVVIPRESEWFEFYAPGEDKNIVSLFQSPIYTEDWIGLKELNENNKLVFLETEGNHLQFTNEWFEENIFPYLNNTLPTMA
jgi:palmitoyl-protein thioesterase